LSILAISGRTIPHQITVFEWRASASGRGADRRASRDTPTFVVNGRRHHAADDLDTLETAVRFAPARAYLSAVTS
jgi:hypothetical protein